MIENEDYSKEDYTDVTNVCCDVLSLMCMRCPHHDKPCMPMLYGINTVNHDQICECMQHLKDRLVGKYPTLDEVHPDPNGKGTGCCKDVSSMLVRIICDGCQLFDACMPDAEMEDDCLNYRQLIVCLDHLKERIVQTELEDSE